MESILPKAEAILGFIYGYVNENEYPPSRQEIASAFQMSVTSAQYWVKYLEKKGRIEVIKGSNARNIKVL